jgi:hypothetical protein
VTEISAVRAYTPIRDQIANVNRASRCAMDWPDNGQGVGRLSRKRADFRPACAYIGLSEENGQVFLDFLLQHQEQQLNVFAIREHTVAKSARNDRVTQKRVPNRRLTDAQSAPLESDPAAATEIPASRPRTKSQVEKVVIDALEFGDDEARGLDRLGNPGVAYRFDRHRVSERS